MENNSTLSEKIRSLLENMTVEEKISFASGCDTWHAPFLDRLGIPCMMMCDGPHGLRKRTADDDGVYYTVPATGFPSASTMANSWNPELTQMVGELIGEECRAEQVSVLLGPGMNIKRSPLCGRNFEYYSEDPYLTGQMAAAFIRGVQSRGVAACAKHFCVNNQETRRFSSSANVSERALHEIYFPAFETAVKEAGVSTIMHSYNRVNGRYVGEDKTLITDLLRGKWNFDGFVMSDWGAISDRLNAYTAGSDIEMPPNGEREKQLLEAYRSGELSESEINESVARVLRVIFEYLPAQNPGTFDKDAHHQAAAKALEECVVLLKNENAVLPFETGAPLAVIGGFAKTPRFQGGGSSHVTTTRLDDISEFVAAENGAAIEFAPGYDERHETNNALIAEAVELARKCKRALIFAGLPDSYETEGRDRRHMRMPAAHNRLIEAVSSVCDKTVVVLLGGSPAELPWIDRVPAVLHAYLGGQALGSAIVKIVFGKVNPSGKLAETHPKRLEDNPSYLFFPGSGDECFYGEDIYVGYRYYDKKKMEVLFPFGHGLSYTDFAYTSIRADGDRVFVTLKNTGRMAGKEVVQLYCGADPNPVADTFIGNSSFSPERPLRWLCGFRKIELDVGEEKTVEFLLNDRMFSVYDEKVKDFRKVSGTYTLYAGGGSRNLPLEVTVTVDNDETKPVISPNTTFEDLLLDTRIPRDVAETLVRKIVPQPVVAAIDEYGFTAANLELRRRVPKVLRMFVRSGSDCLSLEALNTAICEANEAMKL